MPNSEREDLKRIRDNISKQQQKTYAEKLMERRRKNAKLKERSNRAKMLYYDPNQNVVGMSDKDRSNSSALRAMFVDMYKDTPKDPEEE